MTYSLKSESYSKYINEWAYEVYKEYKAGILNSIAIMPIMNI